MVTRDTRDRTTAAILTTAVMSVIPDSTALMSVIPDSPRLGWADHALV